MLLPSSQKGLPLPVRNAGESPIRTSTSRNNRRHHNSSSNSSVGKDTNSYAARHEQRHLTNGSVERGTSPAGQSRLKQQRSRSSAPGGARDPAVENVQHIRGSKHSALPDKIASSSYYGAGGSSSSSRRREGGLDEPRGLSTTAATTLRSSGSAVERGLAGVGASLRSSWSVSAALPAMPNGEAVPALLSHLAELRSMCQRQRDAGKSMRGALVRKQGELDEASAEVSWLRAELGFIVGDMLGALQGNPTPGTVFSSLSERIRCDLGAEEAVVYIDIGDGTLWLLPTDSHAYGEEVFIQRGVGVVGLVAMGAVPGAATATGGGGRPGERARPGEDGVDVLLLNDGLEAFDNGTTVEAALLRAARHRRSGGSGGVDAESAASGTVRNMLLARVGSGVDSRGGGCASAPAGVGGSEAFPEPPTAVIQALNKQAAPERFTEGDARAVRTLAPAIAAGSRLIVSLLNFHRSANDGRSGGRQRAPSWVDAHAASADPSHRCPEELLLHECVRRARDALGADRARVFVLDSEAIDGRLRLWHEDPLPPTSAWARSSHTGLRASSSGGRADLDAGVGLQGVALSTGRAARSADALSDPLHDRELDLKEGFLSRSVLCAPLLARSEDARGDGSAFRSRGSPLGVLQLAIGRGREAPVEGDECGLGGESRGSRSGFGFGDNINQTKKKAFVDEDERLSEEFARDIARFLACLLRTGFRPRASATTLAGGGGHAGAGNVAPTYGPEVDVGRSASWHQHPQDETESAAERDATANVYRYASAGTGRNVELTPADLAASPPSLQAHAGEPRPPVGCSSRRDGLVGGSDTSPRADSNGPSITAGSRRTVGQAEARDSVVHGPLGSSTTSTAGPSPLGAGVRASVATVGQQTPTEEPPQPPSPATDDSTYGNSPDRPPNQEGSRPQAQGSTAANSHSDVRERVNQQPLAAAAEDTQARSWAAAHRVLEACKEGLSANQSALHRDGSCGNTTHSERLAPVVRLLVTSLLPGCTPVLLLFDSVTGRLWEARGGPEPEHEILENAISFVSPRPVRREDVARRALASGKALLAQAGEKDQGEAVAGTAGHEGGGSAGEDAGSAGGRTDSTDHESGDRVFCVPVCGSAGRNLGVLQLFLPPLPQGRLTPSSPVVDFDEAGASVNPRGRTERGCSRGSPPSPPPPSFFMASKILADSVGLALGWCGALDRQDEGRAAEAKAFTAATEAADRAQERSRGEAEARHREELRAAEELHTVRTAEAACAHALAVEKLIREREALAVAAVEAAARAKGRRDAGRAFAAWHEASKRGQRAERVTARMCERRRARAFREWRSRNLSKGAEKKAEAVGAAASDQRGVRRALGTWAKSAVHGRCIKERHLAGARLLAAWCRRGGRVRPYFSAWKGAARGVSAARQALTQKDEEGKRQTLAHEEISRSQARAKFLSDRVVELSQRRRREREARSACKVWFSRARQLAQGRESVRLAKAWRRRRNATAVLTRWRLLIGSADISAGEKNAAEDASKPEAGLAVTGSAGRSQAMRTAPPRCSGCAAAVAAGGGGARLARNLPEDNGFYQNEDAKNNPVARLPTDAAATPVAAAGIGNDDDDRPAVVEEHLQRLTQAAAGTFRRQRERLWAMRLFVAWRCAVERERSKREALSRLLRHSSKHLLSRGFWRWHAEARDIRAVVARGAAEKEIAVATTAANTAVAANAATETLACAREQELQRAIAVSAELQKTVEALQTQASGSALRQRAADSHLVESSARASLLSLAVARAFCRGRDRLLAGQALTAMKNAARARRHASSASERVKALRLSRFLQVWRDKRSHARHRATTLTSADAFAADFATKITRKGAHSVLQLWSARATRRDQRQRGMLAGVERVKHLRQHAAILAWRGACFRRRDSATAALQNRECLALSNARRGLERWRRVTFGDGCGDVKVGGGWRTGGRVLTRLVGVAVKVDEAGGRRRAREALRRWLGHAKSARRRAAVESRANRLLASGSLGVALLRWRAASLVRLRLRRALDRGAAWAALHGTRRGWCMWQARTQLAARRKALSPTTIDTTPVVEDGPRKGCASLEPKTASDEPVKETPTDLRRLETEIAPAAQTFTRNHGHAEHTSSPTQAGISDGRFEQLPQVTGGATNGADVCSGSGSSNQDLLDLLVDVCAAPPPYSLGSGIEALGHDACRAAMRTFGLLSASLFEVVGGPQATAVRVAIVQAGGKVKRRSESGGRGEASAAASAVEAMAECGLPDRERLGDGTVGVAAQSARPVCVEVLRSSSEKDIMGERSGADAPAAAFSDVAAAAALTVLCVPVMLQATPLPKVLTGFVGDGEGDDQGPISSVEVVGVLRAVRAGTGAFAGDDARALSAFCGQVALAMVAERVLAEIRAGVVAEAAKEARVARRQACRRVATLFAEGAVAGALLQHTVEESATQVLAASRASRGNELWASVAGLAAQALGCERIDLLRVESLTDGGGSAAVPMADILSQRPPSRSFRRRSRDALLAARASSRSLLSSKDGSQGDDSRNEAISSWLCVPVLSPSSEGIDLTGGTGGVERRERSGAVSVCCAVNKKGGRSFDDVDEAMLGTIAALYAVASSWLPLPPPAEHSDAVPGATNGFERTNTSSPSGAVDSGHMSGITSRGDQTTGVNTCPSLGGKRSGNSSMSLDAILPPLNNDGRGGSAGSFPDGHRRGEPPLHDVRGAAGGGRGKRGGARASFDLAGESAAREQTGKATGEQSDEPVADFAATERPGFNSRPQPRFLDDGSYGKVKAGSSHVAAFQAQAVNLASKEYSELRDRAERAERMLETTRGRLCRALEDGASNAAAAAAASATAAASVNKVRAAAAVDHVEGDGGDCGDGSGDSGEYLASDGHYREDESVSTSRRGLRRHYRGRSAERLASTTAATAVNTNYRRSSSVGGSGAEKRDSPARNSTSSSDIWDGQGHYHTDDAGERRRWPAREQTGQRAKKEHRRRRRHSSTRCMSSSEARPGERGRGGKREGSGGERKDGGGEPKRMRSKRRQQLRASDLTRMREVIARLRTTTAELEAERAHRLDAPAAGVEGQISHFPSDDEVHASGAGSSTARQPGRGEGGPLAAGAEAAALQQENSNLRRKLFGLMALEELEGRAVQKGLLPLTGGGVIGGDFFSHGEKSDQVLVHGSGARCIW